MSKTWFALALFGGLVAAFTAGSTITPGDLPVKKMIVNIQVNGIIMKARAVYSASSDFGNGNIVPVITAGQEHPFPGDWIPPNGYTWSDRWETDGDLIRRAVEGMTVTHDGKKLHSEFIGEVLVRGKGALLKISFPDCPRKLCPETSALVSIR